MADGISNVWSIERKIRQGVEYVRVVMPSFETEQPEMVINYWADGRITLDSSSVLLRVDGLWAGTTGCNLKLTRTPINPPWNEQDGPEPDRISLDPDYI